MRRTEGTEGGRMEDEENRGKWEYMGTKEEI